jgi:hypothetical protein
MTTITLEVPDELAAELHIAPAALPNLLREAVAAKIVRFAPQSNREDAAPIYQEIIELLTSGPTAAQLVAFKISDAVQERLEDLLANRQDIVDNMHKITANTTLTHACERHTWLGFLLHRQNATVSTVVAAILSPLLSTMSWRLARKA